MSHLKICIDKDACGSDVVYDNLKYLYSTSIIKMKNEISKGNIHINSGFDLYIPQSITLSSSCSDEKGEVVTIDHLISCAVYDNAGNPLPYYLYPRSSISKSAIRLANQVGIIDSGYRGHIMAKIDVVDKYLTLRNMVIGSGERYFQLCSHNLLPFESVEIVDSLDNTERGTGGFGSTGC